MMGISPSVYTFNILFMVLLKRGRIGMVYEVFDEMLKTFGVKPDLYSFNILIRGFCKNKMVDRGYRFFMEMEKFGCEGDVVTYNTIVDGLCRAGKVGIARNVLRGMSRKGLDLSPNVVTYTTLIRGYCGKGLIDEASDVYEEMITRGIMPNEVTYNTLIPGLCEAHKLDRVKEVLEQSEGFVPDTCTFNILMKAHCDVGNLDEARKVFDNMSRLNVRPDSASYSVLIRCFCMRGLFERAEELFDELSGKEILLREDGCTPLVAAFNPVFEYLSKSGKTRKAEKVFRQLMRRGTQDALAFEILIMGHCREASYEAGYALLVLMQGRSFVPNLNIYESLIDGLQQKAEFIRAYDTLGRMLKDSHIPRTSTFHSILAGLLENGSAREATSLIKLMLEKKVRPTMYLSTNTLKVLFKHRLKDRAFETFTSLHECGYRVNMEELVTFLCQERKLVEAYELLLHSIKKEQTANLNTCNMVLTGLCKIGRISEAFKLYYEVIELKIPGQLGCLEDLRIALQAKGRLRDAEFLAKRMVN
ncbi:hypothetical protein LIER_20813 [Lithospermum erythrorhizon]|uniref:Pentatricopeptide repeat-containing protein n=1 Tax=Lithospermum erythrorhizon TaxID=34254 RepID=A0AAV3QTI3_LITER